MNTSRREDEVPEVGRWRYVGDVERVYMNVPVTVQHGAVIEWAGLPAGDGCWEPADDAEVTHLPDNVLVEPADGEQQQMVIDDHHDIAGE